MVLTESAAELLAEINDLTKNNPEMRKKLNLLQIMDPVMKKMLISCENRIIVRLEVM